MSIAVLPDPSATDPDPKWASRTGLQQRWRVVAVLTPKPAVDIVIPVHNHEKDLARSVGRLHSHLEREFPFSTQITIADGASTDSTLNIAARLASAFPDVRLLRLNESGRGRALAAAWLTSDADVVAEMEVGLADIAGLMALVAPIVSGDYDITIGGRPAPGGRNRKLEAIGWFYSKLLRLSLGVHAQAARGKIGALRADVARRILPKVANRDWLFDTELILRAELAGLRINELQLG